MTCVAVFAALLSACGAETPVGPDSDDGAPVALASAPAVAQEAQLETGCARFEVRLRGRDSIAVARTDGPACGTIRLVLAGEPEFDRTSGHVRLGIALENAGGADLGPPALVYGWEDSLRVTDPPGLARNQQTGSYLEFVQPDSVVSEVEADLPGARLWRYDPVLDPEDPAGYLAAGDTSGVRWLEIAVHDGVLVFTVALGARAQPSLLVPATPPDSVPQAYYRDENVIEEAPCTLGPLLSNILVVSFTQGSSRAERSAAVAAVDGVVVGGRPISERGFYLVLVPDDGTGAGLCDAQAQLRTSPAVSMATPVMIGAANYLAPTDGPGWQEWALRPREAAGDNWHLEAIAAPLAWGCEVGSPDAEVAVVDSDFHLGPNPELARNVNVDESIGIGTPSLADHGTMVAALIAAEGNDSTGMTGVMWRAGLRLYDWEVDARFLRGGADDGIPEAIARAAMGGAKIVNISAGVPWGTRPDTLDPLAKAKVDRYYDKLVDAVRRLENWKVRVPLMVFSAGNEGIPAWWNGYPRLADDPRYGERTLVVGSIDSGFQYDPYSNHGPLVGIAAPGPGVHTRNRKGEIGVPPGAEFGGVTSFAAPLVTGIGGLLLSFDDRLEPPELKQLLVDGADSGGITADGVPIANAYESLKLAAARNVGAPLCGNFLWAQGGTVLALREDGPEPLFDTGGAYELGFLGALHGGHHVQFFDFDEWDWHAYGLGRAGGPWAELADPFPLPPEMDAATRLSLWSTSHDLDRYATVRGSWEPGGRAFTVAIEDATGRTELGSFSIPLTGSSRATCVQRSPTFEWDDDGNAYFTGYQCAYSANVTTRSESAWAGAAYSPMGDSIYVFTTVSANVYQGETWATCPWAGGDYPSLCLEVRYARVPDRAEVHSIAVTARGETANLLWSLDGRRIHGFGVAEGGDEAAMQTESASELSAALWAGYTWQTRGIPGGYQSCTAEYRDVHTGELLHGAPLGTLCAYPPGGATISSEVIATN